MDGKAQQKTAPYRYRQAEQEDIPVRGGLKNQMRDHHEETPYKERSQQRTKRGAQPRSSRYAEGTPYPHVLLPVTDRKRDRKEGQE